MSHSLLFELGVEELPSSFVDAALAALPSLVSGKLTARRLSHENVHVYGTPRRLAFLVEGLSDKQSDIDEEVLGPPETAAFRDGVPTKAAEAFANKLGVQVSELVVVEKAASGKQKAGRYVVGRQREKGLEARAILGAALLEISAAIPFRKSMRWGTSDVAFGRPIQWIVALLDEEVLPLTYAGIASGRETRGHRFLSPETFALARAGDYEKALRDRHVVASRTEREALMMSRVADAAKVAGGTFDHAEILVTENASLVEEPLVVTGHYAEKFLALPAEVIKAVARGHQRYFCVEGNRGLVPAYVAVVNTANDPERIAKGMNRVMTARLSDAMFFYEEDKKVALETRVDKLQSIVFHNRLGTVRDKVARLEELASYMVRNADGTLEVAHAMRAAHLCKFDLVSLMVGEFPELQGQMGRAYALHAGEHENVAEAIEEHYHPLGADGAVPSGGLSCVVALADRIDTLVGCFAVGLEPTGSADPYALRRNCIAALRILAEAPSGMYRHSSLEDFVRQAYEILAKQGRKLDLDLEQTCAKVLGFAAERLRGLLAARTSTAVADCVMGGTGESGSLVSLPGRAFVKAAAIHAAHTRNEPWLAQARGVAKRLSGISKDVKAPAIAKSLNPAKPEDVRILELASTIEKATSDLDSPEGVENALRGAALLAQDLEAIFEKTLVNDPADPHTPARLETLAFGAFCMLKLGDFTKLG
ncbi:MAG: glycine--tRNA ligase subunit beta [Polyangiaceae bacterium]